MAGEESGEGAPKVRGHESQPRRKGWTCAPGRARGEREGESSAEGTARRPKVKLLSRRSLAVGARPRYWKDHPCCRLCERALTFFFSPPSRSLRLSRFLFSQPRATTRELDRARRGSRRSAKRKRQTQRVASRPSLPRNIVVSGGLSSSWLHLNQRDTFSATTSQNSVISMCLITLLWREVSVLTLNDTGLSREALGTLVQEHIAVIVE